MRTLLTTNVRDEDHIAEWFHHHLALGFTHIYIVDHKSKIPVASLLEPVPKHLWTVERCEEDRLVKVEIMERMHRYALANGYDWTIHLDGDEYLVLNDHDNISRFLTGFEGCDQVGINWMVFGSCGLDEHPPCRGLRETYMRSEPSLNQHVKTFLRIRPGMRVRHQSPHVYFLEDMSRSVNVFRQPLDPAQPFFSPTTKRWDEVPAFVAHYIYQAYGTYLKRKINLPRDDNGEYRDMITKEHLHSIGNQVVNTSVWDRYLRGR